MAITSRNALIAAAKQRRNFQKASQTSEGAGLWQSLWKAIGYPAAGATPATGNGAIPDRTTVGALPFNNPQGSNLLYLERAVMQGATIGTLILYDRLWHNSGFSGIVTTAQNTTPPALTRPDALGADVEIWGEVYTAMGATATVMTASYTNQAGTAGRSATYSMPANALTVGQMFPFDLQAGDTGVRTIASVTLSLSTGTAGDFGLIMLRRIAEIPLTLANGPMLYDWFQLGDQVYADACIAAMVLCSTTNTGQIGGGRRLVEG